MPTASNVGHWYPARPGTGGRWTGVARRAATRVLVCLAVGVVALLPSIADPLAAAAAPPVTAATRSPAGGGWTVRSDGEVAEIGGASYFGSLGSPPEQPVVGIASTADGGGYWLAAANGAVWAFGDAVLRGSAVGLSLKAPIVGITAMPDGGGYWLVAADGGIFSYGYATFHGSAGSLHLNRPIVGMAVTPDGGGYWLVGADGGIFSYGDAPFHGSAGSVHLNRPVIGMTATPDGGGYWLVAADGGIFSYGDAPFRGSLANSGQTAASIVGDGRGGYWIATAGGATDPFLASPPAVQTSQTQISLGVLGLNANYLRTDTAAGIRWGVLNLEWAQWEPEPGVVNTAYVNEMRTIVNNYDAAGWRITVDIGLQVAPGWVLALPDGTLIDQYGDSSLSANFEFSAAVQSAANAYIGNVVGSLPGVSSYRVAFSPTGEMMYPQVRGNQWWAYDAAAQGGGAGRPASIPDSPMPGWVPGTATWRGQSVTPAMASAWYDWYLKAVTDTATWQILTYRAAGFEGQLQLVMPGDGARPDLYAARISSLLADTGNDPYYTMNTGAVWWRVLASIPLSNTELDISSVGDGSGTPANNGCQQGDTSVDRVLNPAGIDSWSDTRWLSYLAARFEIPVVGENTGYNTASDLPAIMYLVGSCHLGALQWAWDTLLNNGGPDANLSQLVAAYPLALAAAGL